MAREGHRNSHPSICLLASHALFLEEYGRKLSKSGLAVRAFRLRNAIPQDVGRLAIPKTSLYVVDGHDLFAPMVVGTLVKRFPKSRVLVLGDSFPDNIAFPLLELGARGLLNYTEAGRHLAEAAREVARGGFWVDRHLLSRFVDSVVRSARHRLVTVGRSRLSRREQEVFQGLVENLSNKEIANRLNISQHTAKFHVSNLLAKFDVRRRADLIMLQLQGQKN